MIVLDLVVAVGSLFLFLFALAAVTISLLMRPRGGSRHRR